MAFKKAKVLGSLVCAILALNMFALESFAQTQKRTATKKRDTGQNGVVVVDGAAVYESANFDSPVMDYLDRGKSVFISKKVYKGAGGLGAFYKMRVRKGVFGYITDVDVQISGKPVRDQARRTNPKARPRPQESEVDPNDPTQLQPELENEAPDEPSNMGVGLYLTRYLGGVLNQYQYAEEIAKKSVSGSLTTFGVKMTGPGSYLGGLPIDYELNFATSYPSEFGKYYKSASGFMMIGHAMALLPATETKKFILYYGLGLMAKYTRFDVVLRSRPTTKPIDSQELAIGAAAQLGAAYAFTPRYVIRGDVRYYLERESYPGFAVAFQLKY